MTRPSPRPRSLPTERAYLCEVTRSLAGPDFQTRTHLTDIVWSPGKACRWLRHHAVEHAHSLDPATASALHHWAGDLAHFRDSAIALETTETPYVRRFTSGNVTLTLSARPIELLPILRQAPCRRRAIR
ncbi:hypothetical protein [Allostreptomyces psammosilenae]|uniref:Uncharacterized protein n=1 Tax=Allostreptomyces psammosilenae TaxID=1892865 RepID=A0A853A1H4_9ACTN|nr:hypothetical protein [Allostreptomyces psammosilenae]NYI04372.1 hypothetical protein [Allostreptomyces psammosilenae]